MVVALPSVALDGCFLALGSRWGTLCSKKGGTCFIWAEDGKNGSGWIELQYDGRLATSFGAGTWKLVEGVRDESVVELNVSDSRFLCRLSTYGRFVVESRTPSNSGGERGCSIVGWSACDERTKPVIDDLSHLSPAWGKLCRKHNSTRFHYENECYCTSDMRVPRGWLELCDGGILITSSGNGTWEAIEDDNNRENNKIEMIFDGSSNLCCLSKTGRFCIERRYDILTGQKRECSVVGWPVNAKSPAPVADSLGPQWGELCRKYGSSRFVWAHDGKEAVGWIEFHEEGILCTSFGIGTWELVEHDTHVVEMVFGSSSHVCRLSAYGRFVVEGKYYRNSGKKHKDCSVAGWPEKAEPIAPAMESLGPRWGPLCREHGTTRFAWAYDGKAVTGWLEFHDGGVLFTSFGNGTWKLDDDGRTIYMVFGSSRHVCRLSSGGRFVVCAQFYKGNGKPLQCSTVGWPDSDREALPIGHALGPVWGKLCHQLGSTRFAWAHDGREVTGWIEFQPGGILFTSFGNGTWELMGDSDKIEMEFGTSRHVCRLQEDGRFTVEAQYFKCGQERTCCQAAGWAEQLNQDPSHLADIHCWKKRRLSNDGTAATCGDPQLTSLESRRTVLLIGIAGPSGVGKTCLAQKLAEALDSPVEALSLDWFFQPRRMPMHEKWGSNWERPEGVDFTRLRIELARVARNCAELETVPAWLRVLAPNYRKVKLGTRDIVRAGCGGKALANDPVFIVIEGFLLFYDTAVCDMLDLHLWVDADCETCLQRRLTRDKGVVDPSHAEWFRSMVWTHYEEYKVQQLANAKSAVHLDGTAALEVLTDASISHSKRMLCKEEVSMAADSADP